MVERWIISAFEELRLSAKVKPVVLSALRKDQSMKTERNNR